MSLTCYRGKIAGGGTVSCTFTIQTSTDLIEWDDVLTPFDPGTGAGTPGTQQSAFEVPRRFVRVGVTLAGTEPTCTLFAAGWASRSLR